VSGAREPPPPEPSGARSPEARLRGLEPPKRAANFASAGRGRCASPAGFELEARPASSASPGGSSARSRVREEKAGELDGVDERSVVALVAPAAPGNHGAASRAQPMREAAPRLRRAER